MSVPMRPAVKGSIFALFVLLAVGTLALVVAPTTPGVASAARQYGSGRDVFAGIRDRIVPPVFGPNVRANSDTTSNGQHEPSLAVSRTNPNIVVVAAKDYRNGNVKQVWIDVSTDGGATWPIERQVQIPGIPPDLPIQSDPVVMARADGRIYVAALGTNKAQNRGGVFITWTDDGGATWRNPSVAVYYPKNALDDKEWFAIDNNPASPYYQRMYMMYAPGAGYVVEQHSTDGGETWSTRQQIGASGTEYTYPVVGSDGTVYNFMMLNWGPSRQGTVQLTKSTDGGLTWTTPSTVATAFQPGSPIRGGDQYRFFAIISAAVDPNTGALYAAWTDNRNFAANGTDVVYVKSADGGATWGPVTRLSHDPTGVVRDHITPMITVGADSRLHAFWLDRRLDPANRLYDSWYSSSTDGGATWDPDTRVSTEPQDLNLGLPPGSGNAAGDYWGLDTVGDTVYVAWNDTRLNGQQDILVSKGVFQGATTPTLSPTLTTIPPTVSSTLTPTATATSVLPTSTAMTSPVVSTATATSMATAQATSTSTITPTPSCAPIWRVAPGPNIRAVSGVAAVSYEDAWAVGDTNILRWGGSTWTQFPHSGGSSGYLRAVSADGPGNAWVVGVSLDGGPPQTLIERWDGIAWSRIPSPNVGTQNNQLTDITIAGPNDVWAVGSYDVGTSSSILIERWNGSVWSVVDVGGINGSLYGITARAPNDVWAVGQRILHWDGSSWREVYTPSTYASLYDVAALTATDAWAVGSEESNSLIVRWNGSSWSPVLVPNVGPLSAIAAISASDIWAVGANGILHWNGSIWSIVPSPAGNLNDISALDSTSVWAVGRIGSGSQESSLMLRYTDQQFTDVPPSNPFYAQVECLACRGIISGYSDGTFRPNNPVTRGQLAKIVSNSAGFTESPDPQIFQDVPPADTFYKWINRLTRRGYMTGYECGGVGEPCVGGRPYFRPFANATRGQTAKIVSNAAGFTEPPTGQTFEDVPPSHTFYAEIQRLASRNVMQGYSCGGAGEPCITGRTYFRPGNDVTRGQSAKIVANAFFPGCRAR